MNFSVGMIAEFMKSRKLQQTENNSRSNFSFTRVHGCCEIKNLLSVNPGHLDLIFM